VLLLDSLLDVLHLSVAVFITVLLHDYALFFFEGTRPDLNIVDLLVFRDFEGFSFTAEDVLVEGHDRVIIDIIFSLGEHVNTLIANFLDVSLQKFVEDFSSTFLSARVQLIHELIPDSLLLIFDLLTVELFLLLHFLNFTLLS
jgi:hypothetical protein